MRLTWKLTVSILWSVLLLNSKYSQCQYLLFTNAINTGGYYFQNDKYKLSSNIGEMSLVSTLTMPEYILTHGVLQPLHQFHSLVNATSTVQIKLYPTILKSNVFFIHIQAESLTTGSVLVSTVDGIIIFMKQFQNDQASALARIDIPFLSPGLYLASVQIRGAREQLVTRKTFKIIKH